MNNRADKSRTPNPISGVQIALYLMGVALILVGGYTAISSSGSNLPRIVGGLAIVGGVVILLTTSRYTNVAKYLTCLVVVGLSGVATSDRPIDVSILGYVVSITLAGALIDSQAVLIVAAVSMVVYLVGAGFGGGLEASLISSSLTVAIAFAIMAALMYIFSTAQRRLAQEAQENSAQLALKNAQLEGLFVTARQASDDVLSPAQTLIQSSTEQQSASTRLAEATLAVTSQVSELAAAATQIAAAAKRIRDVGERTQEMAGDAKVRLDADHEQLTQAVSVGEQLQAAAKQVGDNVRQMGQIVSIITEVAEETHMLSLNATIEATGTGEHGRRFKVIAAEVGNLASKVNSSTEQIGAIVLSVQRTVQTMVSAANTAVDSIKRIQVSNMATETQIREVELAAREVAQEGFLIVSSTAQQKLATEAIAHSLEEVSSVAQQAAASSQQLAGIAEQLRIAVGDLEQVLPVRPPSVQSHNEGNSSGNRPVSATMNPTTKLSVEGAALGF